jgi:outer membrane protein OmpA-like peptidoglycan-associated protein
MSLSRFARAQSVLSLSFLLVAGFSSNAAFGQEPTVPKADIFAGYQWLNPGGNIPATPTTSEKLPSLAKGVGASVTYNFAKNFGLSADFGTNFSSFATETTYSVGPRFMWRTEGMNIFAHTMLSLNRLEVTGLPSKNGIGAVLGGGFDLPITKSFSWRVLEADYVWARHNYADVVTDPSSSVRRPELSGARLRSGIVFNIGGEPELVPAAACAANPTTVMVGEPVTVIATPSNFNPKHTVGYAFTTTGGKLSSKDASTTVDTAGMAGGNYTVTATATDARKKKNNVASCNASFTVKEPRPPTMTCSANPAVVQSGTPTNITCTCSSPDGVPVTVAAWNSATGKLSGSGNTASLDTAGVTGPVSVSATCTDSRGLTANSTASVTVENPPPPPVNPEIAQLEARLALHSVYFATAKPTKQKPDGGLVDSQQATLTTLAADFTKYLADKAGTTPVPHLILEGHADPRGGAVYNQALSERRVERVKSFLVERGVPAENIETKALGDQHNLTAEEVQASVDANPELTPEERARVMKNKRTIILASNRRVDVSLNTTGQTSVRQYPFNATDSLTLIGGRQVVGKKAPAAKKPMRKKKK